MKLDLDKRYFEYIPPEQCGCDCGAIADHLHSFSCSREVGIYRMPTHTPLDHSDFRQFLSLLNEVFQRHPAYIFLKNHRLVGSDVFKARLNVLPVYGWSVLACCFNSPFGELFWGEGHACSMTTLELCRDIQTDHSTSFKIYKQWDIDSYQFGLTMPYNYRKICKVTKINDIKHIFLNQYFSLYDVDIVGKKQAWLGWVKSLSMYDDMAESILTDALNETAPQFFKEQG